MDGQEALLRLGLALAIGLLVGVERHWRERDAAPGSRTAGLRTFGLSGLLGGVSALAATAPAIGGAVPGALLIGAVLLAFSAGMIVFKLNEAIEEETTSVTGVVAAILVFLLGSYAVLGDRTIAAAAGVTMTALLASREVLHGLMRRLTWAELRSAIIILVMSAVILPLVPRSPVGPFGGIDLAEVWTLAILMAAISFAGYLAVKLAGERLGLIVGGALGGLASSTAVTLANARRAVGIEAAPRLLAAGAMAASAVSVLRIGALALVLRPELAGIVAPALAAAAAAFAGAAIAIGLRGARPAAGAEGFANPFDLRVILRLTLLIALAAWLVKAGLAWLGPASAVPLAGLGGLADADAVILSLSRLSGEGLPLPTLATAILAAIAGDIVAKSVYALLVGGKRYGLAYAGAAALALGAGTGAFMAVLPRAG